MRSRQSASDMIREALRNESKGCASGVTGTEAYRENRRRRRRSEKEVENGGGKRPSSDLTASDDSERVKRLKVRHENASAGEVSYREEGEETEESDHLEYLLEDDYSEELQWHNIQNERANDEQPGWWRDAVAQLCKRCPEVDAQVSMLEMENKKLEAAVEIFEGRIMREEQERRRLEDFCEKLKAESMDMADSEKTMTASYRTLDNLCKKKIEGLTQDIAALTKKAGEDEKACRSEIERLKKQINALLEENEKIKSLREKSPNDTEMIATTSTTGTSNMVLDGVPDKAVKTLQLHIESCQCQHYGDLSDGMLTVRWC